MDTLFEVYNKQKTIYFVVEHEGKIVGGSGIAPLENGAKKICELQKMYFAPKVRGIGFGEKMIQKCLDFAKEAGFEKCYLETLSNYERCTKVISKSWFSVFRGTIRMHWSYQLSSLDDEGVVV